MRTNRFLFGTRVSPLLIAIAVLAPMSPRILGQVCVRNPKFSLLNPITTTSSYPRGESLAASSNALLVGVESHPELGKGVWVMRQMDFEWTVEQKIYAPLNATGFGTVLAIDDDVAVISAPQESSNSGAAYVYRFNGKQWMYEAKLVSPQAAPDDKFGQSLAICDNVIIVGAPFEDEGVPVWLDHGYAYAFRFDGSTWQFEQKFAPDEVVYSANARFGGAVAVHVNTAVVGSTLKGTHVYTFDGTQWNHEQSLPPNAVSLTLDESRFVAGVPSQSLPGTAFVFELDSDVWVQIAQLSPFDANQYKDDFGRTVAMNSDSIVIGAPLKRLSPPGGPANEYNEFGAAYAFQKIEGTWTCDRKFVFANNYYYGYSKYLQFSSAMALTDSLALFGVPTVSWFSPGSMGTTVACDVDIDCNANGEPDACETPDCNGNQVLDFCEFDEGRISDCNGNSVPDTCEINWAYALDSGIGKTSWGISYQTPGQDMLWLNQFNVVPGCETVDVIGIMWRDAYRADLPVTVLLYDDPNGDGNPTDAVLLAQADVRSKVGDQGWTTTIEHIAIKPTYIGPPGHSFFVAAKATVWAGAYPAASEYDTPEAGRSWGFLANVPIDLEQPGPSALALNSIPYNIILRAGTFDCNGNDIWDQCDITSGFSLDFNNNGIPDECDGSCIADLAPLNKGNGVVDVDDLLELINAWGACEPKLPCPADIAPPGKPNSAVDADDLLELINNWGPCT